MGAVSGTDPCARGAGATSDHTLRVVQATDSPAPAGVATLAEQQAQTTLLQDIKQNTADIEVKAENINLNTDTLEALIGTGNTSLADILAKIIAAPATEATVAAILAKIIAAPATEAKQDTLIAKDFATQTTLAAVLAKIIAAPATEAKQDTGNTSLASLDTKLPAKGTALIAASTPVNIASDQTVPVSGPLTDAQLRASAVPTVGRTLVVTIAQAVTATAYEAGDAIGGKITLANAVAEAAGASLLHQIVILDRSNTKPSGHILIFNADPAAATITDEAAFVFSTDDLKCVARIPVAASDYATIDSKATADLSNLGRLVKAAAGTTLYAAFVADGVSAPTFAATTDLQIVFKFIPN